MSLNAPELKDVQETWLLGHGPYVDYADLHKLDINDQRIEAAFASRSLYQATDLVQPVLEAHGREPQFDGQYGPGVRAMLASPRCGHPDQPLPPEFHNQLPQDLRECHQRMRQPMRAGRGSWRGCHDVGDAYHSMVVETNLRNMPARGRRTLRSNWTVWQEVCSEAQAAKAEYGLVRRYRVDGKDYLTGKTLSGPTNSVFTFEVLRGSTMGLAIVGRGEGCSTSPIWLKINPRYNPSEIMEIWIQQQWKLLSHENSHNEGAGHFPGDPVQNPSLTNVRLERNRISRTSPLGRYLISTFGGVPYDLGDDIGGPPKPPANELEQRVKALEQASDAMQLTIQIQREAIKYALAEIKKLNRGR